MLTRSIFLPAALLGVFALIGTGLVALTYDATRDRIAENERTRLLQTINELVPTSSYDNNLFDDTVEASNAFYLGDHNPVTVYRARRGGQPVAAVFTVIAPNGYSGSIRLLVAINTDGTLAGVRAIAHRETPGLGDGIEKSRSDWIDQFVGASLGKPDKDHWKVRRDGGVFDQLTGATITPRAVVRAVYRGLVYFRDNREKIFAPSAKPAQPES